MTLFDTVLRAFRFALRRAWGEPRLQNCILYPPISSRAVLGDILNRVAWYLPGPDIKVRIHTTLQAASSPEMPTGQRPVHDDLPSNIRLITDARPEVSASEAVLVWDWHALPGVSRHLRRLTVVDPEYFSMSEAVGWADAHYMATTDAERLSTRLRSRRNYAAFKDRIGHPQRSYLFTTGPSIDQADSFDYEPSALKVVCNSMVRNTELLKHIKPQLIVFADPVFHFSPCTYSAEFRQSVLTAVAELDAFCMVPERQAGLLLAHHPELSDRLIGVRLESTGPWHWPTLDQLATVATGNIMTLFMLPVAAAHSTEIFILGADGRSKAESYFWKHSSRNQFDEHMQSVFETHPSFFRDRVYTDYYDRHCKTVRSQVETIEASGRKVFALTPSAIPALEIRLYKREGPDARV